jgi:hypothetical protein
VPNQNTQAAVYVRDRFTCRYCSKRLVLAVAVKLLESDAPGETCWHPHWKHQSLSSLGATVDHVTPVALGGFDDRDNLVACCVTCNSGRKIEVGSPRERDDESTWDGYAPLFLALAAKHPSALSSDDRKWVVALEFARVVPDLSLRDAALDALRRR